MPVLWRAKFMTNKTLIFVLSVAVVLLSGCVGKENDSKTQDGLALINQYYPDVFALHNTLSDDDLAKNLEFVAKHDPNLRIALNPKTIKACRNKDCTTQLSELYNKAKHSAEILSHAEATFKACDIPLIGVADKDNHWLVIELDVHNPKQLDKLAPCAKSLTTSDAIQQDGLTLHIIAPSSTHKTQIPSPITWEHTLPDSRQKDPIYVLWVDKDGTIKTDVLDLYANSKFYGDLQKRMIAEARKHMTNVGGYIHEKELLVEVSPIISHPKKPHEMHAYVLGCSEKDRRCTSDIAIGLAYNHKTKKFTTHKVIKGEVGTKISHSSLPKTI